MSPNQQPTTPEPAAQGGQQPAAMPKKDKNLRTAALVFMIISCAVTLFNGFSMCRGYYLESGYYTGALIAGLIIAAILALRVFFAVRVNRIRTGTVPNTTAFAIVILIFGDIIAGILLLISKKDEPDAAAQ